MFGRGVSRRTARRTARRNTFLGLVIGGVAVLALSGLAFSARRRRMSMMQEGGMR